MSDRVGNPKTGFLVRSSLYGQLMAAAVIVSDKRVRAGYSSFMYFMFVAEARKGSYSIFLYVCGTLFPSN